MRSRKGWRLAFVLFGPFAAIPFALLLLYVVRWRWRWHVDPADEPADEG